MARLLTMGFELNSLDWGVELDTVLFNDGASISLVTGRRGGKALRSEVTNFAVLGFTPTASRKFLASAEYRTYFVRLYIFVNSVPSATSNIIATISGTGGSQLVTLKLSTSNKVIVDADTAGGGVATSSSALATNTWHRIDLKIDIANPASTSVELRVNNAFEGLLTGSFANGLNQLTLINATANANCYVDFDDIAINDSTGSYQNSYPPEAQIIALSPSTSGEFSQWSSSSGSAISDVDELPPLISDYISASTLDTKSFFTVQNPRAGARVHLVELGCQCTGGAGSNNAQFKVMAQIVNSGNITYSPGITPANTTQFVNSATSPIVSPLIMYANPNGTAWTPANLKSLQIGVIISAAAANATRIGGLWALAEVSNLEISNVASVSGLSSITGS